MKECYLTLRKEFMLYKTVGTYETLDPDTEIWNETKGNYRFCRRKDMLTDISMYFDNKEQVWSMGLEFSGISTGPEWMFNEPKEALKVYEQLLDYMLTG